MDYTVPEAQKLLGYKSRQAINLMIDRGVIIPSRTSPMYLIPASEIKRVKRLKKGRKNLFSPRSHKRRKVKK